MSGLDRARRTVRFVSGDAVPGTFSTASATCAVTVRDLSVDGAQIEHSQPLRPAMQGRLATGDLDAAAVVIWTRMSDPGRYRSGLQLEARLETVAAVIRGLLARGAVRKVQDTAREREQARVERSMTRQRLVGMPQQDGLSAEAIRVIRSARQWLLANPDEAVKWHQRVRATADEDQLRIAAGGRLNREDVLAVWELLGRRCSVLDVVRALDESPRSK